MNVAVATVPPAAPAPGQPAGQRAQGDAGSFEAALAGALGLGGEPAPPPEPGAQAPGTSAGPLLHPVQPTSEAPTPQVDAASPEGLPGAPTPPGPTPPGPTPLGPGASADGVPPAPAAAAGETVATSAGTGGIVAVGVPGASVPGTADLGRGGTLAGRVGAGRPVTGAGVPTIPVGPDRSGIAPATRAAEPAAPPAGAPFVLTAPAAPPFATAFPGTTAAAPAASGGGAVAAQVPVDVTAALLTGTPSTGTPGVAAVDAPSTGAAAPAPASQPPLQQQVLPRITSLVSTGDGSHEITVRVDPEEFGPVRVVAEVRGDEVRVLLHAATDAGRDALRACLTDLRRDLEATGLRASLDLGSGSGGDDTSRPGHAGRHDGNGRGLLREDDGKPATGPAPARPATAGALDLLV